MSRDLTSSIHDYLSTRMNRQGIPAIAFAVMDGATVTGSGTLGTANLEWDVPAAVDTVFQLASATKPLTGTLLMLCVERGEIRLDAPVAEYVPAAPATWAGITIRHLATHTSGLPDTITNAAQR